MPKPVRAALLAAVIATLIPVSAASAQLPTPEGRVNFTKAAESGFDSYTLNPSAARQQWMRDHYWRMRTYPPYFDTRTDWYPGAWAYKDAYAIYRGSSLASEHPDWILKDIEGNRLYIPYACDGSSCTQYAADVGNPEWRRHYIDAAKSYIARGYRGIFVDDVNFAFMVGNGAGQLVAPVDPRTGARMTHDAWQRYFAEFMEQLRADLPAGAEIVQNQVYFHVGLSSPYVKRAIDAATHIEVERGINDMGIRGGSGQFGFETVLAWVDYAHSRGKGVIYDIQTDWGREYALATYFLTSTSNDGIGMEAGSLPDAWWTGWDTDLGAALTGRYTWNGTFRRDFERGSVFVNQPDQPARTLTPEGSWTRLDGSAVTSVTLASRDGLVLLRQGAAPPPPPEASPTPAPAPPPPLPSSPVPSDPPDDAPLAGGRTDLASGKLATSSSTEVPALSADKAVDGDAGTRFGSAWADDQWWQVDLGAVRTVGEVTIAWEAAYASSYKVLTSVDGQHWTETASVTLRSATTKATTFPATAARYVRILGVRRATQYGISFWDVRIYGGDVVPAGTVPAGSPQSLTPAIPPGGSAAPPSAAPAKPALRRSLNSARALRKARIRRCRILARRGGHAWSKHRRACRRITAKHAASRALK